MVTITAKTASENAVSRSAVIVPSRIARSLERARTWSRDDDGESCVRNPLSIDPVSARSNCTDSRCRITGGDIHDANIRFRRGLIQIRSGSCCTTCTPLPRTGPTPPSPSGFLSAPFELSPRWLASAGRDHIKQRPPRNFWMVGPARLAASTPLSLLRGDEIA